MIIRAAVPHDLDEWIRMRRDLWPGGRGDHAKEIAAWFDGAAGDRPDLAQVLVVERESGGLCGLAELGLRPCADGCDDRPVAYLEGIWVDADRRRTGVATALLRASEAWARARGGKELASDFLVDDDVSRAWHRAAGFEEIETAVRVMRRL